MGGGTEHEARGGELFPSFSGEEAGRFRKVAGVSVVAAGCLRSTIDASTVDVQPSYYELILRDVNFYGIIQALTQATRFH